MRKKIWESNSDSFLCSKQKPGKANDSEKNSLSFWPGVWNLDIYLWVKAPWVKGVAEQTDVILVVKNECHKIKVDRKPISKSPRN